MSLQNRGRLILLDQLDAKERRLVERAAKALLAGVGAGPRRWQHGDKPHVLHVRRKLSSAELAELRPGPPASDRAGAGRLYNPLSCRP